MPKSTEEKMKLLLDESGHVVVRNDKPVYTTSNGNEIEFDALSVTNSNHNLKNEVDTLKSGLKEKTDSLNVFGDLDPVAAKNAIDMLAKNGDVSERVTELEEKSLRLTTALSDANKKHADEMVKKDDKNFKLELLGEFKGSEFLKKTKHNSRSARAMYSDNFKKEEIDGQMVTVGRVDGKKIFSQETNELASFDEALQIIIESSSDANHWMKATDKGGNGAGGGESDTNANRTTTKLNGTRSERVKAIAERFPELE